MARTKEPCVVAFSRKGNIATKHYPSVMEMRADVLEWRYRGFYDWARIIRKNGTVEAIDMRVWRDA